MIQSMLGTSSPDDGLVSQSTHWSTLWVFHTSPRDFTQDASPSHSMWITKFMVFIPISSKASSTDIPTVDITANDLYGYLPAPQCWPGIWRWWITVFFSSTILFLLPLSLMISCFTYIETLNETVSPSDVLGASLALCVTIISSLNFSPRIPLTKALLLVTIEALIVCSNGH